MLVYKVWGRAGCIFSCFEFLANWNRDEYSNAFGQGAWEICLGIVNDDDRYKGMYEFSCWYRDFLNKRGLE
jgi:hypothetical protein